jgi:hypothetical protein
MALIDTEQNVNTTNTVNDTEQHTDSKEIAVVTLDTLSASDKTLLANIVKSTAVDVYSAVMALLDAGQDMPSNQAITDLWKDQIQKELTSINFPHPVDIDQMVEFFKKEDPFGYRTISRLFSAQSHPDTSSVPESSTTSTEDNTGTKSGYIGILGIRYEDLEKAKEDSYSHIVFHLNCVKPPMEWILRYGTYGEADLNGYKLILFYEIAYWRYVRENKEPITDSDQIDKIVETIDKLETPMDKYVHCLYDWSTDIIVKPIDVDPEEAYDAYVNIALGPYAGLHTKLV